MSLVERLARTFLEDHPPDAALVLERMPVDRRAAVVREMGPSAAAALGAMMPAAVAECVARLEPADAGPALERLPIDRAVAVLRRVSSSVVDRALQALPHQRQEMIRRVLQFPQGTAGALMDPSVPELPVDITASEARVRIRRAPPGPLQYVFIVERSRALVGVLDVSELLRAGARAPIRGVMNERVHPVPAWMPAAAVRTHPGWETAHVLPVVDDAGRLVGALRYEVLRRLEREADARQGTHLTAETVGALGELFHLGLAGFIEGVATAAAPRSGRARMTEGEAPR